MLSPNQKRYADRIKELINEGKEVARIANRLEGRQKYFEGDDSVRLQAWLTSVGNILENVFGEESIHYKHFREVLPNNGIRYVEHSYDINPINGILVGALDDLEKGYLLGQEFVIAGDVFDSILEQAKHLNHSGYKDPAAVLNRVVIEDALKRLARRENVDDNKKATVINDELRKIGLYPQPQWRFIQAWLDIGNAAAHGNFNEYNKGDVTKMAEGIDQFLIARFQ